MLSLSLFVRLSACLSICLPVCLSMVSFILSTYRNSGESIIVGLDVSAVLTARVENVGDPATTPVVSFFLPPDVRHSDLGLVRARRDTSEKSLLYKCLLFRDACGP